MSTTTMATPYSLPGVDPALRDRLVARLNGSLATLTDLVLVYKQAHWNILGPDFAALHALFEEFAVEVRDYSDLVAERATTLGAAAHGTLQAAAELTTLPAFPTDERDQTRLLEEVATRVDRAASDLRKAVDASAEDPATQDLFIEVLRGLEKQLWMLVAHLTPRGGQA